MNIVTLTGRSVKPIEIKVTPNGKEVATGTIAVQRNFKNQQGEYESDFLNFVAWGAKAALLANYVNKGDFFGISGSIQTRNFEGQDGKRVWMTEINVQDFDFPVKPKGQSNNQGQQQQRHTADPGDPFKNDEPADVDPNDLPF